MPVKRVYLGADRPEVSVVIPSADGQRGGNVLRLIEQLKEQTYKAIEVVLVIGESPSGHARNIGYEETVGRILIFLDDDAILGHERIVAQLVEPLRAAPEIGATGVSQLAPAGAKGLQRRCAEQVTRSQSPIVDKITDSDMVTTLCMAVRREVFEAVGKMDGRIIAGVDPDLRHRLRRAGYRVVVVPEAWVYHPLPDTHTDLVRYAFKKGGLTAWQYRFARATMYECPDGHVGDFSAQTSLPYRIARKAWRLLGAALRGRYVGVLYDAAYSVGYGWGLVRNWR